jgi:1-aminocyclopropane-1-carboxylate deaminase/D-cysteine desulfhydrase-like pyridoxal-dependent ACC family enzyme
MRLEGQLPDFTPRIHPIDWPEIQPCASWALRDDETGIGLSGGKLRKYQALVPSLLAQSVRRVYLIGSRNSNNLVGLSQLLIASKIQPIPVVPEAWPEATKGINETLLRLLCPEAKWIVIPRKDWSKVENIVEEQVRQDAALGIPSKSIPEGCLMLEGVRGAMKLGNFIQSKLEAGLKVDHILMEAGSGCSAIGLLLSTTTFPMPKLEILSLAESAETFKQKLQLAAQWLDISQSKLPAESVQYRVHERKSGRFGKFGKQHGQLIQTWARRNGILLDPIYSPPLIEAAEGWAKEGLLNGNVLLVVGGGAHTLAGFAENLPD